MSSYFVSGKSINHPSYVNLPWIYCIIKFPILIDILKKFSFKNPFFIPANVYVSVLRNQLHFLNVWMYSTEISCYQLSALHHTRAPAWRDDQMRWEMLRDEMQIWTRHQTFNQGTPPLSSSCDMIIRYQFFAIDIENAFSFLQMVDHYRSLGHRPQVESRRLM